MKPLLLQIDMVMSDAEAGEGAVDRKRRERLGNTVCPSVKRREMLKTPREELQYQCFVLPFILHPSYCSFTLLPLKESYPAPFG